MIKESEKRRNFLSVDKFMAINSYGEYFKVGETVMHEDKSAGEALILSFELDEDRNEVKVNTDQGYAYVDFLVKM